MSEKVKLLVEFSGAHNRSDKLRLLVAGDAGAPLTSFAAGAPKPLFITYTPSWIELALLPNTAYVNSLSPDDLLNLKNLIKDVEDFDYETLVIDRLDVLQKKMFALRLQQERRDFLKNEDWNWVQSNMNRIVQGLASLDKHIIFTSRLKDSGGFDGQEFITKPDLQGGFANDIYDIVDYALVLFPPYKNESQELTQTHTELFDSYLELQPSYRYPWVKNPGPILRIEQTIEDIIYTHSALELEEPSLPSYYLWSDEDTLEGKEVLTGMSKDDKIKLLLEKNTKKENKGE